MNFGTFAIFTNWSKQSSIQNLKLSKIEYDKNKK